jgi:hypothetical protein
LTFFLTIGFGSFAEAQVDPLRSGYIIGRIEIAPGVPLEDCEVRMETFRGGDRYPSARSRCDEDGLFKIDYSPPGHLVLRILWKIGADDFEKRIPVYLEGTSTRRPTSDIGIVNLSQYGTISGQITPATPEQLAPMVVSVGGIGVSSKPDPYGYYLLPDVPAGERQVVLHGIWYESPRSRREMLVLVKPGVVTRGQDFVLNAPIAAQPDPQAPSVAEQTPVVPAPVVPDERPPLLRTDEPLLELGVEVDVNRPGSDYRSFEMRQADAKLCQQACAEDQQCRAWTYVKVLVFRRPHLLLIRHAVADQVGHRS